MWPIVRTPAGGRPSTGWSSPKSWPPGWKPSGSLQMQTGMSRPPPAAQASVLVGTVTFRYLLNLTQQAREERQESGTCQERPFCQGSHTLGLLEPPAPPVPTGSLSDTFA